MSALEWTQKLIAFAVGLQTLELLALRAEFSEKGIWRWSSLRPELWGLAPLLSYPVILGVLAIRLGGSVALLAGHGSTLVVGTLLVTTVLVNTRFRGSFNGGSDFMTTTVLLGLLATSFGFERAGLTYIAVQCCLSYVVSGLAKLRRPAWRTGHALPKFLETSIYEVPRAIERLLRRPGLARMAGLSVITWEILFPLAMVNASFACGMLSLGMLFHCANAYLFGLNRFVWAWLASYPAVWFWVTGMSSQGHG